MKPGGIREVPGTAPGYKEPGGEVYPEEEQEDHRYGKDLFPSHHHTSLATYAIMDDLS